MRLKSAALVAAVLCAGALPGPAYAATVRTSSSTKQDVLLGTPPCSLCLVLQAPGGAHAHDAPRQACAVLRTVLHASQLQAPARAASSSSAAFDCHRVDASSGSSSVQTCVHLDWPVELTHVQQQLLATRRDSPLQALLCSTAPGAQLSYRLECPAFEQQQKRAADKGQLQKLLSCSGVQSVMPAADRPVIAGSNAAAAVRGSISHLLRTSGSRTGAATTAGSASTASSFTASTASASASSTRAATTRAATSFKSGNSKATAGASGRAARERRLGEQCEHAGASNPGATIPAVGVKAKVHRALR